MASEARGEFLTDQRPYPELYAEAGSAGRRELLDELWGSAGRRINGVNITLLDTFRLSAEPADIIRARLGVSAEAYEDPASEETAQALERVNQALEDAHAYLTGYLGLQMPASLKKPARVASLAELETLLKKTALFGPDSQNKLAEHAAFCDYLSVALATYELQKTESLALEDQIRFVEDVFTRRSEENGQRPLFVPVSAGATEGARVFKVEGIPDCRVTVSFRGKSATSQITKFLMKPEASAREAQKDAIGVRVEAPRHRITEVMHAVLPFLVEHFEASKIAIENANAVPALGMVEFEEELSTGKAADVASVAASDTNPRSDRRFETLKAVIDLRVPEGGIAGNMTLPRMMEFQIFPDDHRNEAGLKNHNVYELKKKIDVMTRLHGGCKGSWLEKQARQIPQVGGPKWEKIRDELLASGKLIKLPGKRDMYGSADVYARLLDAELLPQALRPQIAHALGRKSTEG